MLPSDLVSPPAEFSLCPFWFWNDHLTEEEIARQMADFRAHGVYAFVIHPRVGLPRNQGWMSPGLLGMMRFALGEALRTGMWVVLYDEGMYPSGSGSGTVVAEDPEFACRGLFRVPTGYPVIGNTLYSDSAWTICDRPLDSVIRGLHYLDEGPEEEEPPAADLLNPRAMEAFIRLVYDRLYTEFAEFFGSTIKGIFTDEPSLLGRSKEAGAIPGTRGILAEVERLTGGDLSQQLPDLWDPESEARRVYEQGLRLRLEETYYQPLSRWCCEHGVALMGHPERPDDLSALRYFQIPGQDLVWRWVLPGPTAIEGPQSTQAKAAESAMVLGGHRRNSNELAGAYGHGLTFAELRWLVHWCALRGCNLFVPHAFYYSVRGPRKDERPPDVGPNQGWWGNFGPFALECARLAWLNTDSVAACEVAILENPDGTLPWQPAKTLYQNQIDFHYLPRDTDESVRRAYRLVIGEAKELDPTGVLAHVNRTYPVESHPDLRLRRIKKDDQEYLIVHNEGSTPLSLAIPHPLEQLELETLRLETVSKLQLPPFALVVLLL